MADGLLHLEGDLGMRDVDAPPKKNVDKGCSGGDSLEW